MATLKSLKKKEEKPVAPETKLDTIVAEKVEERPPEIIAPSSIVKMIDWFDDRYYTVKFDDGVEDSLPSSSTVLGIVANPQFARWRGDVGNELADARMEEAAERGSRIHHACTLYMLGGGVIYQNPFALAYTPAELEEVKAKYAKTGYIVLTKQIEMYQVYKFQQWVSIVKPVMLHTEYKVASRMYRYAGTMDYLFDIPAGEYLVNGAEPLKLEGGLYLADLKSSKEIDDNYGMQTASYVHAYREMNEMKPDIKGTLIIHTNAKTKKGIEGVATILRNKEEVDRDLQDFLYARRLFDRKKSEKPKVFTFPSLIAREV